MMPVLDGKATFAKIKDIDELARIPVVFMTAKVLTSIDAVRTHMKTLPKFTIALRQTQ